MLPDLQNRFAGALLQPLDAALAPALAADLQQGGLPAAARLTVYRNSVQASLIGVLEAAFPVTAAMAGRENFRVAARRFVCSAPPCEARLLAYGAEFPAWLAAFGPARAQPWLAEMARLEWARNEALFAEDADPLPPERLTLLLPERIPGLRLEPHPSARLVCSDYSLQRLWESGGAGEIDSGGEHILVLRPAFEVLQIRLSAGNAALLAALFSAASLASAAEAALALEPGFDLQAALFEHLRLGSFRNFRLPGDS
ncbi:MAG: putative DNA-binding domain-containing protein [Rhodospirillales bacterium]|nr:putative DNA-binding domain-containing protein [Rhodospirillales bacterium]